MKIKKIKLKNGYKRFQNLTIDLGDSPKRIIALVGSNGCGKSSVFDGMLFLASAHQRVGNSPNKNYKYHSMHGIPSYNYQNVEVEFDKGKFEEVFSDKQKSGIENTIYSFRSPYRYNSNLDVKESKAVEELRLNLYGAGVSADLDAKMEQNYRRLAIKYNNYLHHRDIKPSSAAKKIIGDLNNSITNCLDLKIVSMGNIAESKGTLFFRKNDSKESFEFNVLSSGEKEVVDLLLDLYLRKEDYSDTIFLIDEPELHINTSIQRKLLTEINKLVGKDCQIWIATHSIGFLRALQEDFKDDCQIIHFPDNIKWASSDQLLEPISKTRTNWLKIFETALDDLTGLVSPKRLIYCEGRDKPGKGGIERGLDATVYNNIFSEKHHDTLFVSSGGNTELDQRSAIAISILSKVFQDVDILVLKDRDMDSGKPATQSDREEYLKNNPENHRVLKRFELENYLYEKETLQRYCNANGLSFDEESYNKLVTNVEDQDLKEKTNSIKEVCSVNINTSNNAFKKDLSNHIVEGMSIYGELESCIFGSGRGT